MATCLGRELQLFDRATLQASDLTLSGHPVAPRARAARAAACNGKCSDVQLMREDAVFNGFGSDDVVTLCQSCAAAYEERRAHLGCKACKARISQPIAVDDPVYADALQGLCPQCTVMSVVVGSRDAVAGAEAAAQQQVETLERQVDMLQLSLDDAIRVAQAALNTIPGRMRRALPAQFVLKTRRGREMY